MIEPLLKKKIDFSVQLEISRDGKVKRFEPRFFRVDAQFQYQGAYIGAWAYHPDYVNYWKTIEANRELLQTKQDEIVRLLREKNYHGPVGIDSLIYEDAQGVLQVEPVIEVNVRYTMGRVAQELEKTLRSSGKKSAHADGVWVFINKSSLIESTVSSFTQLEERFQRDFAEQFIATTPAATAISTWTVLLLGPNSHTVLTRF